VTLRTQGLSKDVDITNGAQMVVPTRGAAGLARFTAVTGRRVQFELRGPTASPCPLARLSMNWTGQGWGLPTRAAVP
jgi:outer membrane usher protein